MKPFLTLLIASSFTLHAETEKEFGERVAKAWNSKIAANILALYGDPAKLDPDFKKQISTGMIDYQLKSGFTNTEVTLLPPDPADSKSFVMKGKIVYQPSKPAGQVKIAFLQDGKPQSSSMTSSFVKFPDGALALAVPAMKSFEWTGGEMTSFNVRLESEKADAFSPGVIVVVEKCGHVDWLPMNKNISFPAHKITSLVVSPTPDSETLTVVITKGMETEPVFKKTVNTSKGAIIPIGIPAR